ncbi:MAG: hypothetical protein ACRETL_12005 [Gammaproteobacteria bacterium]
MTTTNTTLIGSLVASAAILATPAAADDRQIDYFPGIDCKHDFGRAVETICKSDRLLSLEDKITQRYSEAAARANKARFGRLLYRQREYLADRNACGSNRPCLERTMQERIDAID